jgi:hypothetical protein
MSWDSANDVLARIAEESRRARIPGMVWYNPMVQHLSPEAIVRHVQVDEWLETQMRLAEPEPPASGVVFVPAERRDAPWVQPVLDVAFVATLVFGVLFALGVFV